MKHYLKRFKRFWKYGKLGYNGYSFDYIYPLEMFYVGLEELGDTLESDKAYTLNAKSNAKWLRVAVKLAKMIYREDYYFQPFYQDKKKKTLDECVAKNNKAKRILWKIFEQNLDSWWD